MKVHFEASMEMEVAGEAAGQSVGDQIVECLDQFPMSYNFSMSMEGYELFKRREFPPKEDHVEDIVDMIEVNQAYQLESEGA